jgi:predicted double-glycine peptidase
VKPASFLLLLSVSAGSAAVSQSERRPDLLADGPAAWLDVPFVRQERDGCGAASIAMVMQYWAGRYGVTPPKEASAARIMEQVYSREARGTFASEMKRYLEEHGYSVFAFSGEWKDLQQHIAKGRPLIVSLNKSSGDRGLHYVVVTGLDSRQSVVLLNDPARRKLLKMKQADFEKRWNASPNWTLLALPQTDR